MSTESVQLSRKQGTYACSSCRKEQGYGHMIPLHPKDRWGSAADMATHGVQAALQGPEQVKSCDLPQLVSGSSSSFGLPELEVR